MFEITADDIALLSEEDLREFVGRLCECEVRRRGFSTSSVTWGGHQNAVDGGVDVRVSLPHGSVIDGFVPRPASGFQVKGQDFPRHKILMEMSPKGVLRTAIRDLANQSGAYVIVSSKGSTSDSTLRARRVAMAEATKGLTSVQIKLDFYDRNRLATWVRDHAGLALWVRERIGKATTGWRPYDSWAYDPDGVDNEYLLDDTLRIRTAHAQDDGISIVDGIERIRDRLRDPRGVVRLVGLSGVGKTRLVQALFDSRVGQHSLDSYQTFYTNIANDPDPQPTGLASDLIAARTRAVLVIDNCTPELHRRISEVCRSQGSTVSVITIEYDIREDQPEGTDVFELDRSSDRLVEKLIGRRYQALSPVDIESIADFSGGNLRIAIALAETVGRNETIQGLSDEDLFQRLFHQRNQPDPSLLLAAQACSLVYSFQGEDVSDGDQAELMRIGSVVRQGAQEMFRHVAELKRRELVQQRGIWRAVLPPAIANRLAAVALDSIPYSTIESQLLNDAPERLMRSFSRRLGYLDQNKKAIAIVERWLVSGGLLHDVTALTELGRSMFENVAPVAPESALSALEQASLGTEGPRGIRNLAGFAHLLRSIAYDAKLFERCATLISKCAGAEDHNQGSNEVRDLFSSLFLPYLSGTHATVEQRLAVIKLLLLSVDPKHRDLGSAALKAALKTSGFVAPHNFDFGSRSRDYGYWPRSVGERQRWFGHVLQGIEDLACSGLPCAAAVRSILAEQFPYLWAGIGIHSELEVLFRAIGRAQFWPDGWIAVRRAQHLYSKGFSPEVSQRLASLEQELRPADLVQKVRSIVLTDKWAFDIDFEDNYEDDIQVRIERTQSIAVALGRSVAADELAFTELLGDLVTSVSQHLWPFALGLVEGAPKPGRRWRLLLRQLAVTTKDERGYGVFQGFLHAFHVSNPQEAAALLDDAVENDMLAECFPLLQVAAGVDTRGVDRLVHSLTLGRAPIHAYRNLAWGRASDLIPPRDLKTLLLEIAAKPEGFGVAAEILWMRLHSISQAKEERALEILDCGQKLMSQIHFGNQVEREDHHLEEIAKACLLGEAGERIVRELCERFRLAISRHEAFVFRYGGLLCGLFSVQPMAALDGIFGDDATRCESGAQVLFNMRDHRKNPLDSVSDEVLVGWCDQEPGFRYSCVAGVVTAFRVDEKETRRWTTAALSLLAKAPDRVAVIKQFVRQFAPMSWSGSRATIIESNAGLLDELKEFADAAVVDFVNKEKTRLKEIVEYERRHETETDKWMDERFE